MCETMLCPVGMTHIANAGQTQCDDSPCSEEQCCMAGTTFDALVLVYDFSLFAAAFLICCAGLFNRHLSCWRLFFLLCLYFCGLNLAFSVVLFSQRRDATRSRLASRLGKFSSPMLRAKCVRSTNARKANVAPPADFLVGISALCLTRCAHMCAISKLAFKQSRSFLQSIGHLWCPKR